MYSAYTFTTSCESSARACYSDSTLNPQKSLDNKMQEDRQEDEDGDEMEGRSKDEMSTGRWKGLKSQEQKDVVR